MARPSGEKTRNGGKWTEARYASFIKNLLRSGTRKWGPIQQAKKDARVRRGVYICEGCGEEVPATKVENGKRVNNVAVDHDPPVIDPEVGFVSWDSVVERLFCERDHLKLLCYDCHKIKTNEERAIATERRRNEKESK